jgi:hypothetical protein
MFIIIHSFRILQYVLGVWMLLTLASSCSLTTGQPAAKVTFIIPVPVEDFSPAALRVSIWNAQQLRTLDQQAECVIAHDMQTGTDSVHCPEGVQYQKITPEDFVFPIQAIDKSIQLASQTVRTGEKYQIILRGLSSDDCNSTSAVAEGTTTASTITLENLDWMTTAMACIQP